MYNNGAPDAEGSTPIQVFTSVPLTFNLKSGQFGLPVPPQLVFEVQLLSGKISRSNDIEVSALEKTIVIHSPIAAVKG